MNKITKIQLSYAAILVVAIFAAIMIIAPGFAHAQYSYGADPYSTYNYGGTWSPTQMTYPVPVVVQYPVYVPVPVYYPALSVSCSANVTSVNTGNTVVWTAYVSGGNGSYSYTWNGTDGLRGYDRTAFMRYDYAGQKYASVTVYSNGQSITQNCGNTIAVYAPVPVYQPIYTPVQVPVYTPVQYSQYSQRSLDVACYADPTSGSINQPVTWNAEVTGGVAPYRYSWTGSDGLYGSDKSLIKYYSTSGEKYAVVTVTGADGVISTRACSNSITIKKAATTAYVAPAKTTKKITADKVIVISPNVTVVQKQLASVKDVTKAPVVQLENTTQTAGTSSFSLSDVPWAWVAILIIFLLFATVLYLVFNRQKI
ncbi:MAG: hypothetical protein WCV79_02630 [Candidatus Paceibacterota bacterium]|jgi:hypothetical protein